jgi:hypothetical protein
MFIKLAVLTSSSVIERKRDTMLANKNVFECQGQSVTHDELGPPNDRVYTVGLPGDQTAPRQTLDNVFCHDRLQRLPVAVAQSG